ncbi:MAG: AMP-binding protein [Parvibaculum sp.]|uniref:acyl-CoA synthetase n=1 Tax=Parvibaculum sp. TaxID=2024848 RepID=UPI002847B6D3|nr:AMP-binding protein [Parvibaculum sp.]MDR3498653.1 AMP-binding protein [Parvibaculum sp.]
MSLLTPKIARGYTGELPPPRFNLARYCLAASAAATPDKVALIVVSDAGASLDAAERWTYASLDDAVRRIAAGLLAEGFKPGERLMIRMPNTSDYALLFFGAIAAGLVPLPSSSQLTEGEAEFLLSDSAASAIAIEGGMTIDAHGVRIIDETVIARLKSHAPLADYADTNANDPAFLVYTSGTSGRPKGVLHAQRSAWGRRPMYRGWYGISPADTVLHAGAFNWTYTLGVGLTDPWANGATTVLYNGEKDVQVWPKLLERTRATLFAAVPTLYRQILKYCDLSAHDLSALRHGLTAGEALSPALLDHWREATGKNLYEALGMSECSTYISTGPGMDIRAGSPGRPQPGRCVAALPLDGGTEPLPPGETGLLAVHRSDPGLMLGYWRRPDEEQDVYRGEWFIGGDLASFDADGYMWFQGRADDVMNAMGYRVSPQEVEAALSAHPDIAEVAVTEVHVREDVSIIAAFVVPKEGHARDAQSIMAFAEAHLAAYKRPREIIFMDSLPRTANDKVTRRKLAQR